MLAADSFQLISTFLSWASNTIVFLDFDLVLASLPVNKRGKLSVPSEARIKENLSFIVWEEGGLSHAMDSFFG